MYNCFKSCGLKNLNDVPKLHVDTYPLLMLLLSVNQLNHLSVVYKYKKGTKGKVRIKIHFIHFRVANTILFCVVGHLNYTTNRNLTDF